MWRKLPVYVRAVLLGVLALLGLLLLFTGYLSLRYSPEYMVRDLFTNLGTLQIQEIMHRALAQWPQGSGLAILAAALLLGRRLRGDGQGAEERQSDDQRRSGVAEAVRAGAEVGARRAAAGLRSGAEGRPGAG